MKIVFVLLDGLGDRAYHRFGDRTPLQAAMTPNLDRFATWGSNGLFHAGMPGQCFPSETAHYLLFGYPMEAFPGRGLLEAVGENVPFDDEDIVALAHLSQVRRESDGLILVEKRPPMPEAELAMLLGAIGEWRHGAYDFRLHPTHDHDALLVIKGQVSPHISDSDPMMPGQAMARICALENAPRPEAAARTAEALNAYLSFCHTTLAQHPVNCNRRKEDRRVANFLATQRCGRRISQSPFEDKWGLSGRLIASGAVYGGLANELGLAFTRVEDTDTPAEDLENRLRLALDDRSHDFVFVHTKVPDEAAHTGDPERKRDAVEALDAGLGPVMDVVASRPDDLLVAVTADHSTPSVSALIHSGEPVPAVLVGRNVRRDEVCAYDEISAARGCLGFLRGPELILMLLNYADRSVLVGHQLGGRVRPYVSRDYPAFGNDGK